LAGHAPELLSPSERLRRWLNSASDTRLSLYMLGVALFIAFAVIVLFRPFAA
jgi:hypothetical protein